MRAWSIACLRNLMKLSVLSASLFGSVPMSAGAEKPFPSIAVEEDEIRLPSRVYFCRRLFCESSKISDSKSLGIA